MPEIKAEKIHKRRGFIPKVKTCLPSTTKPGISEIIEKEKIYDIS